MSPPTPIAQDLAFIRLFAQKPAQSLLKQLKQIEKRSFPSSELYNIDHELPKRTTSVFCACLDGELYGYIAFVRSKLVNRIHKVCVKEEFRGKGVGRWMLENALEELKRGGAQEVDLWVDEARATARKLYSRCGFEEEERVDDYYGPGRHAVRMMLSFTSGDP